MELFGWAAAKNINIECLGETISGNGWMHYNHLLNKFPQDIVFVRDENRICFLDGYVTNKDSLVQDKGLEWENVYLTNDWDKPDAFIETLRGGFCGYIYDIKKKKLVFFTDQTGNKAIYYYIDGNRWLLSNSLQYMVQVLMKNQIECHLNNRAVKYMLTCGFMLDNSTFVQNIYRLLPGKYAELQEGSLGIKRYYMIPHCIEDISESVAIDRIDKTFRQAIAREFEKDREYGYHHLVDLSGGLDSRMVTWVAHEMGYVDQLNVTYCKAGYADQKIAEQISGHLGHEYLYKALDDVKWMYDVDEMTNRNNGAAVCLGMTGGNRLLQELNTDLFGIEHTGMVGDAILSTFYHDEQLSHGRPQFGLNQYSQMVKYNFDERILAEYPTQEIFAIYTRGILGAQSSYITRQHYVETASPFLDVDFLNTTMTLPFAYRNNHSIYLQWIAERYPYAAEFGWEKWGGVKPKKNQIIIRRMKTMQRLVKQYCSAILRIPLQDSMNPMDYWYHENPEVRLYLDGLYEKRIRDKRLDESLQSDMIKLYEKGQFTEKSLVLTVLSSIHDFMYK